MKSIFKNRIDRVMLISFPLITIAAILFYVSANYQNLSGRIESVKIELSNPLRSNAVVIYISDSTDAATDFTNPHFAQSINDSTLLVDLGRKIKLRQFRLYFQEPMEEVTIKSILLESDGHQYKLDLRELRNEDIQVNTSSRKALSFSVLSSSGYSYFESLQFYYPEDYTLLLVAILSAVALSFLLYLFIREINSSIVLTSLTLPELGVIAFIFSIFLPQVFFNVTLVISILLVIRNFRMDYFLSNRINLLFVSFYVVVFLNFIFFTPTFNFTIIEKYTPFLVLPIYVSCIKSTRLLVFFCVSAFLIGGSLLVGAFINISIFRNLEIISNDNFTEIIHPVYYSYLLAFSTIYVEFGTNLKHKYWIHFVLLLLLVLSGSKLIILALLAWSPFFLKKSIKIIAVSVVIIALFIFGPLRERFISIIELDDLSIISEDHIKNPDDARLNGFTLRVILWQESLRIRDANQLFFGNGVGMSGDDVLEANLRERGLTKHLWYNAHNQYVTTFFTTGLVGVTFLILILLYCFRYGARSKDPILMFFILITSWAMLSESVFERTSGIVFFGLIMLLIINGHVRNSLKIEKSSSL